MLRLPQQIEIIPMIAKKIIHGVLSGIVASILLGMLAAKLGEMAANGDPSDVSGLYIILMPIMFGPIAIAIGLVASFLLLRKSITKRRVLLIYLVTFLLICVVRYAFAGTIA